MNNDFLVTFFNWLKRNEIEYCVLRNYLKLPYCTGGSDLDILVGPESVSKFYAHLDELMQATNSKIIIKYGNITPRLCIVSNKNGKWLGIQLDVHNAIFPYKNCNMFPVSFVLDRSFSFNGIQVANESDAKLIGFLKEVLHNGKCTDRYFKPAQIAWSANHSIYKKALSNIYGKSTFSLLENCFKENYSQDLIDAFVLSARLNLRRNHSSALFLYESLKNKIQRFYRPPGFTIALLGADGAGKTTVINKICAPLNAAVHNSLYYEHMRPNLIPNISQVLRSKKQTSGINSNPHLAEPSGFVGSLVRLNYYFFDYTIGYLVKVYPVKVKKSCIWIFDRYYFDYKIDPRRARINLPNWIISFYQLFLPHPDLILCLGTKPEYIHSRKPELSLEELTHQMVALRSFCENKKNAIWIDTGGSIETSSHDALKAITDIMSSRYADEK